MMGKQSLEVAETGGLWRRSWLRMPEQEDNSSHVLWMQGKQLCVDLRLPASVMGFRDAPSLSALDAEELRILARAEGFAGTTAIKDSVCSWTRHINLQGPLKGIDSGRFQRMPDGLLETGMHAQYKQLWQSVDTALPRARSMIDSRGQTLIILWTATRFAMGRGWHERTIHTRSLLEHVDYALNCQKSTVLACAFDQEFCFGRIEDDRGIIEHSTQPPRCGALAFDAAPLFSKAGHLEVVITDFFGETRITEFRVPTRSVAMA